MIASNVGLAALLAIFPPGALSVHQKATLDTTRVSLALGAKTLVLAAAVAIVATASCLAAYLSFELLLADHHLRTSLADLGVRRAVLGGGLYLTAVALLGLGLGAALRSNAGATATLLGLLLIPPLLLELLPDSWKTAAVTPTRRFRPAPRSSPSINTPARSDPGAASDSASTPCSRSPPDSSSRDA